MRPSPLVPTDTGDQTVSKARVPASFTGHVDIWHLGAQGLQLKTQHCDPVYRGFVTQVVPGEDTAL